MYLTILLKKSISSKNAISVIIDQIEALNVLLNARPFNLKSLNENCVSLLKFIASFREVLDLLQKNSLNETNLLDKDLYIKEESEKNYKINLIRLKNWQHILRKDKAKYTNDIVEFINIYFEFLKKAPVPVNMYYMNPRFIEDLIVVNDQLKVFKAFVDGMFLNIRQRTISFIFFTKYLKSLTYMEAMDPEYINYLRNTIINFIKDYAYNSEKLSDGFAFFIKEYLYLFTPPEDNAEAKVIYDFFACNEAENQQIERYQCELALKIFDFMIKELEETQKENVKETIRHTLNCFVKNIEYTKVIHLLIFESWSSMESSHRYFNKSRGSSLINALTNDNGRSWLDTINYDNNNRSEYAVLHPMVRLITENLAFTIYDYYHEIFWAIFDHFNKQGFSTDLKDNFENLINKKIIEDQQKSLKNIFHLINEKGLNIQYARNFFRNILVKGVTQIIYNGSKEQSIDEILEENNNGFKKLQESIHKLMPKGIDRVDYSSINETNIILVMSDKIKDENLLCNMDNAYFLGLTLEMSNDFSERFDLFSQFIKELKPKFDSSIIEKEGNIQFFNNNGARTDELLREVSRSGLEDLHEQTDDHLKILRALGFLNSLLLKRFLKKIDKLSIQEKYEKMREFVVGFDALVMREISFYKFTLENMFDEYNRLNPQRNIVLLELEAYERDLKNKYEKSLTLIKPNGIERFERNQILAINAATIGIDKMFDNNIDKYLFLKVATGNGKTLVQAITAVEYIKEDSANRKVLILSAFTHLSRRDQENMEAFFNSHNISSCLVDNVEDVLSKWDKNKQILFSSTNFINLVSLCALKIDSPKVREFLKMVYSLENQLILIDEFDLVLDKHEQHFVYNAYSLFSANETTDLKHTLKNGKYKQINNRFNIKNSVESNLNNMAAQGEGKRDKDGSVSHNVSGMGAQIAKGKLNLKLAVLSLKEFFARNLVIGFSGSIDKRVMDRHKNRFPNITENYLIDIPLFFAPGNKINPNIKAVRIYANRDQFNDLDDIVNRDKRPLPIGALQSREEWIRVIKDDIAEAQSGNKDEIKQPVIIFVNDGDTDSDKEDLSYLTNALGQKVQIYKNDNDARDENLQKIALSGTVSICTKKIGRGADIRIPTTITKGMHVIIARPDYREEIIQEVGRTGRMNRQGSFSMIFHSEQRVPTYEENDDSRAKKNALAYELSKLFYTQENIDNTKLTVFAWFLYNLINYYDQIFNATESHQDGKFTKDELIGFMRDLGLLS